MATIFSHAVAAASLGTAFPRPKPARFWIYGMMCSMIPDVDVIGFRFGIRYGDMLGHRGFTHSIAFAVVLSALATVTMKGRERQVKWQILWPYLFLSTMSHGILDAMTSGGLGVAFFAPFVNTRYFFPFRPIRVSPIGSSFFSARGLAVLESEMLWIWIPSAVFALVMIWLRKVRKHHHLGSRLVTP